MYILIALSSDVRAVPCLVVVPATLVCCFEVTVGVHVT